MSRFPNKVSGLVATEKQGVLTLMFGSLDVSLRQAEASASPHWRGERSSDRKDRSGWYGTRSLGEAVRFGRYGWKAGRERIVSGHVSLKELSEGHASIRSESRDIYGCRPDVPLYCAGEPEHMIVPGDMFGASAPLVDLVVSGSVSSAIDGESVVNYGAALASLIDQTEAEKRRVQVSIFFGITGGPVDMHVFVRVKRHSEPLDIDRLAFALACPSMFRRIVFSLIEQVRGEDWFHRMQHGYGRPKHDVSHGNSIVVPCVEQWKGDADWKTPVSAYQTMKQALEAELNGAAESEAA